MNVDDRKKLETEEEALLAMFRDSVIDRDVYGKRLISLAYQYAKANDVSRATPLLGKMSEEYYRQVMPKQMEDDPVFANEAYGLAEKLVSDGHVTLEREYQYNKAPAKA